MPRLAVITTSAPPSASGQARVLGQILRGSLQEPAGGHLFLSDQLHALDADGERLGTYVALRQPRFQMMRTLQNKRLQTANNVAGLVRDSTSRAGEIAAAIRAHPVDVVVGCSGNPFDLPASYLAAKRLRLPFVAYLFDDPVFQWEPGTYRRLGRFWEHIWGRGAAAIVAPNEVLRDDVLLRVPRAPIHIVRNPVDLATSALVETTATPRLNPPPTPAQPWTLLYTGSVYSAQASAFQNLVAALNQLDGQFRLEVFTSQGEAQVRSCGLVGPHVTRHDHLPQAEALKRQRRADVLFLPLAFDSPIPEVIRSSAPAKVGEYLASGRPVLVHAPRGSFVSELFRSRGAGLVVDTPDVAGLVSALRSLADDAELGARMIAKASLAAREFQVDTAQAAFWSAVSAARKA